MLKRGRAHTERPSRAGSARPASGAAAPPAGNLAVEVTRWRDPNRVRVEVQTTSGRAAGVEFRVRLDTVEVWHHARCCGVLVRDTLRDWLTDPMLGKPALVAGDVVLSLDTLVDRETGRVAITLPDVREWALSPSEQALLRERVNG
jgi:hypothetical protein